MKIEEVLEIMDDMLDKAPGMPFSGKKSMIDVDKFRDLINEIRLNMPQEIKNAQMIAMDRQTIITDANKDAEGIVRRAEAKAKILLSNEEIVRESKQKAAEILNQAQTKSREIRNATNEYIDNILNETEKLLTENLVDLKKTRQEIRSTTRVSQVKK